MEKRLASLVLLTALILPATEALAQKRGQGPFAQKPVQIVIDRQAKDLPEPELVAKRLCSGVVTIALPSLGECPRRAGYTTAGIAVCTQLHKVTKKSKIVREDGRWIIECVLDYANAAPVGPKECDYSQCFYVKYPEFPWPGTILDELDL